MVKKKPSYLQRKQKEEINKKSIIWISFAFVFIVIVASILLILDK